MRYISTRGEASPVTSTRAILTGLASDGGLYIPEFYPVLGQEELAALKDLDYQGVAERVLRVYLTDYNDRELREMIAKAYGENFSSPEVVPLRTFREKLGFLELWHGPTSAFKDLALQLLPHLMIKAAEKEGEEGEIVLLVATSGDTGKAALEGFKDVPGTKVIVFYPAQGVSEIQEKQMVTQEGVNTYVIGVEGNFDEAQTGVKALFSDEALAGEMARKGMRFSSANSINWGRLAPQIVYYVWAWSRWKKDGVLSAVECFNVVVPTGNFGNILAAYYAKRLGIPVGRLICASNMNKVLTDFIQTGIYDRRREFFQTISPSMDILISSNLERLLYELTGRNAERVRELMRQLRDRGCYSLEGDALRELQDEFWAGFATEEETMKAIKDSYERYGYLLDPHTAVGYKVYQNYKERTGDPSPTIIASTASPFKFNQSVAGAVMGEEKSGVKDEFKLLVELAEFTKSEIPANLRGLAEKPVRHRNVVSPTQMEKAVREVLGL